MGNVKGIGMLADSSNARVQWKRVAVTSLLAGALFAAPAQATFLGMNIGDEIETVGWNVPAGSGVYDDPNDVLTVNALASDITTTVASGSQILSQVSGGAIDITLSLASESLVRLSPFAPLFSYTATFTGGNGAGPDVQLFSPTGGPDPEQDGRLLIQGNIAGTVTISALFNTSLNIVPTFSASGVFNVTGGDAIFRQLFGNIGDIANLVLASSSSIPNANYLLADGYLFSARDTNFAACTTAGPCVGAVVDQSGNFTFSGTGEFIPENSSPFVPEPSTASLLGAGMLALLAYGRRARR